MNISKYFILFLLTVLVVLSGLLIAYSAENKALQKANAVLKEQVALKDAVISEIDKNIASLQQQVSEAEKICNERLKARNDLLTFLSIEPAYDVSKKQFPACAVSNSSPIGRETGSRRCETLPSLKINALGSKKDVVAPSATTLKQLDSLVLDSSPMAQSDRVGLYEVISKIKSDYAVNVVNSYWVQFTQSSDSKD